MTLDSVRAYLRKEAFKERSTHRRSTIRLRALNSASRICAMIADGEYGLLPYWNGKF